MPGSDGRKNGQGKRPLKGWSGPGCFLTAAVVRNALFIYTTTMDSQLLEFRLRICGCDDLIRAIYDGNGSGFAVVRVSAI